MLARSINSHSREQVEMKRYRGGFHDVDAPERAAECSLPSLLAVHSGSLIHMQHSRLDLFFTGFLHFLGVEHVATLIAHLLGLLQGH